MGTTQVNPTGEVAVKRQRQQFNLDTMDEVLLVKTGNFKPVTNAAEAMERLGNSTEKFLQVINDGLEQEFGNQLIADASIPWNEENEDGTLTPFSGTVGDSGLVKALILTMAKNFGYTVEMPVEEKRKLKAEAAELIKNTPAIRAKIVEQAKKSQA